MSFMFYSFYLPLLLAWAMNHAVHTVLVLCLPSATCCHCCFSSSCCCCCIFSKLFSILTLPNTDPSPPLPSSFASILVRWRRLSFCLAIWFYFALPVALYSSTRCVVLFVLLASLLLFPSSFIPSCFTLCNWILLVILTLTFRYLIDKKKTRLSASAD